jgi:phosphatidylglycerol---prolipoprotein diacylglyceryl transferase
VIDPVALQLGPFQVHWYGIIIATATLAGAYLATRVAPWLRENPDEAWSLLLPALVLAVIGARAYHVVHEWEHYSANPALIPQIWNGGIGIPGAAAGGAAGVLLYTRAKGLNTARWLDIGALGLILGQVIGRLGNFVNQELYGPPISECGVTFPPCLPFGIAIDAEHRVAPWADLARYPVETTQFVPLFAYEMALNFVGLLVLLFVVRRFAPRLFAGDLALMYIMWYGAVRTLLETYRTDNWVILGVPTAMWVGILGFVLAGAWLVIRHVRGWGSPMIGPPDDTHENAGTAPMQSRPPSEAPAA